MRRPARFLALGLLSLSLLACESDSPPDDNGPDDDSSSVDGDGSGGGGGEGPSEDLPEKVTLEVDRAGGQIKTRSAKVTIPAGALKKAKEITVEELTAAEIAKLAAFTEDLGEVTRISKVSRFTPHGLTFDKEVTVEMPVTKQSNKAKVVKLADDDDDTWEVVPTKVSVKEKVAKFSVKGFSIYAVYDDPEDELPESGPIEEPTGTGGNTGSGGTGSGGTGSGGSANLPAGYFQNATFHGYGKTLAGPDTTLTSDLEDKPAPNCITGTLGIDYGGFAELTYNLNESQEGGDNQAVTPVGQVLRIDASVSSGAHIMLYSGTKVWCTAMPGTGTQFVPWDNFRLNCDGESNAYNGEAIDRIGIRVLSVGQADYAYQACLEGFSFQAEPDNGYMQGTDLFGYVVVVQGGSADFLDDTGFKTQAPYCATGYMGSGEAYVHIGASIQESREHEDPLPTITPTSGGLRIHTSHAGNFRRFVFIDDATSSWCAPLFSDSEVIPWGEFKRECDGSGATYASEPIHSVIVRMEGNGTPGDGSSCLSALGLDTLDDVGFFDIGFDVDWFGYGRTEAVGSASIFSDLGRHENGPYCASGKVFSAPDGAHSAALLFNLRESAKGSPANWTTESQASIQFDYTHPGSEAVMGVIVDSDGIHYCSEISPGYPIDYTLFHVDCTSLTPGDAYGGQDLVSAGLAVYSIDAVDFDFDFCLQGMEEIRILPD